MFFGDMYRPRNESQLIGESQLKIWRALNESETKQKLLFVGNSGLGKTTLAEMYVLNKLNQSLNKIIRINASDQTGIDFYRSLIDRWNRRPLDSNYQIYIIDEIQSLSKSAQNALLTPLENLPDYVIVICATTEPHKIIDTLKSRFYICRLTSPSKSEFIRKAKKIIAHTKTEGIKESDINDIIDACNGNIRTFDGYLQRLVEGSYNGIEQLEKNSFVFDLIYRPKGKDKIAQIQWAFKETKKIDIDFNAFVIQSCNIIIGMICNGKVKGKALTNCYIWLEIFGDGLSDLMPPNIVFYTNLKRYIENI